MEKSDKHDGTLGKAAPRKLNLLVGFTGSVATIKDSAVIKRFLDSGVFNVRAVYTKAASHFRTAE